MKLLGYEIKFPSMPSVSINAVEAAVSGLAGAALHSYLEGDNTSAATYITGAAVGVTSVVLFKGMAQASAAAGSSLRDLCRGASASASNSAAAPATGPEAGGDDAAALIASSSSDPASSSPPRLKME